MPQTPIGSDAHRSFRETKFFASLDGLRCISILAVIWHHAAGPAFSVYSPAFDRGFNGVTLFFAISGFLITTLLIREKEKTGRVSLTKFYMRRTLRIFPLYYTVLIVYALVVWFMEKDQTAKAAFFENLPYYATYTSNWFVSYDGRVIFYFAWSLATEEQFYLVWPAVQKRLGGRAAVLAMLVALVFALLVRTNLLGFPEGFLRTVIVSIAPAICLGSVLAHLMHQPRSFAVLYRIFGWRFAPVFYFVATFAYLGSPFYQDWAAHFLCTLVVASCVIREDHVLGRALSWGLIRWIGMISYGMYLMHMLALNAYKISANFVGIPHNPLLEFVGASAVATIAATISFKYYESFFLEVKKRFEMPR